MHINRYQNRQGYSSVQAPLLACNDAAVVEAPCGLQDAQEPEKSWSQDCHPEVLADIYEDAISIAIWQRPLQSEVQAYLAALLAQHKTFSLRVASDIETIMAQLRQVFPASLVTSHSRSVEAGADEVGADGIGAEIFYADVQRTLDMFSCLFDADTLGVRIDTLSRAMCPRFHTDKVGVRLITTYAGPATEWIPFAHANRHALGDELANQVGTPGAIVQQAEHIQQLSTGDIALLKGENWVGNEGRGIVHRSPALSAEHSKRLVLTCDLLR